ncbi:hypothetical protein MSG28_010460 [Choristoneura fumiferana]|uniref:Uncharacterized protein n=1 Tax=Choristoneura fumiferana TaxID=7141 RepID=A0ACC0KL72_CHOFU|nr:hypothetical protein MSG28_010460 [Choristoneura fumiferana]
MCSVVFDEMSLEPGLTYDKNKDTINGLVELNKKKNDFADHALVFMLRGAVHKWQQPVAFYFCEGATKGAELKNILKDIISAVTGCGLNPIALICDQGSAFQSTLNSLKKDTERDQILRNQVPDGTITMSGVNLQIIYDPPHLIKGLRNNFLNKNIIIEDKVSKWQDIVDVYKADCTHTEARLLHKLNDQHVIPEKIKKMKDDSADQIFNLHLLFDERDNQNVEPGHPRTVSYGTIVEQARRERLNVHSRAYTAGWTGRLSGRPRVTMFARRRREIEQNPLCQTEMSWKVASSKSCRAVARSVRVAAAAESRAPERKGYEIARNMSS